MFLAINNGGPKHSVLNHYVHTSPLHHGKKGDDGRSTSEEFISRTLGEILLKALKERGVVHAEEISHHHHKDSHEHDSEIAEDRFESDEEEEDDDEIVEEDDDGEHLRHEVHRHDEKHIEEDDDEFSDESGEHSEEEETFDEVESEDETDEESDESVEHLHHHHHEHSEHKEHKHEHKEHEHEHKEHEHKHEHEHKEHEHDHKRAIVAISPPDIDARQVADGSISIHQLRKLLRDTFNLECACKNSHESKEIIIEKESKENSEEGGEESESSEEFSVEPIHPDGHIKIPRKHCHQHTDIEIHVNKKKCPSKVDNTVLIHVNGKKSHRRRHRVGRKLPTRINLETDISEEIIDTAESLLTPTTRSARKLHSSPNATDNDIIDELIDAAAAKPTQDLQFFRNQTHRSARPSGAAKKRSALRQRSNSGRRPPTARARRTRSEPAAVGGVAGNSGSADDNDETASEQQRLSDADDATTVLQHEIGAGIRSNAAVPTRTTADGPAAIHDSDAAAVPRDSVGVTSASADTADILLKQFLNLYDQFKRSSSRIDEP